MAESSVQTSKVEENNPRPKKKLKYNYKVTTNDDTYETPLEAYEPVLRFLNKNEHVIWEPFSGTGYSSKLLREQGYMVVNGDNPDFFKQTTPTVENMVFLTNPPFTLKQRIFRSLVERKVARGAILVRETVLFTRYLERFRQDIKNETGKNLQVVLLNKIKFVHPDPERKRTPSSFYSVWITWGLNLPKDMVLPFEHELDSQRLINK